MATLNFFNALYEDLPEKVHNFESDQVTIALCDVAPIASDSVLADLSAKVIVYTNLSTRDVTTTDSSQTGGTYTLTLANTTLTASGGPVEAFRYVVIYNSTAAAGNLIGWYDYASSLVLADGESLAITFDQVNGLFNIS